MATTSDTLCVSELQLAHRALRREFAAAPRHVRGVRDGHHARARVVADHLQVVFAGLRLHRAGEDAVLWPRLWERASPSTGVVEALRDDHDRVDRHLQRLAALLAEWRRTASAVRGEQLAYALETFAVVLCRQLDAEERDVLPLVRRHLTVREWDRFNDHGRNAMPRGLAPLLVGALLDDATPHERAQLLSRLPAPTRWYLVTVGPRRYRRSLRRVRGG